MLQITKNNIQGLPGYEIKIMEKKVSIQDLLDELNLFFEEGNLERLWPEGKQSCYGCDLCCHEPLPLTSIDVRNICQAQGINLMDAYKYLWAEAQDNVIDITLRRTQAGRCIFLQPDSTCSIYKNRPFLCQTYICCQTTPQIEELRSQVVNMGMDELIRASILAFSSAGKVLPLNRSHNARVNIKDWGKNKFTGKNNYSNILLKNVLSSDLFKHMLL